MRTGDQMKKESMVAPFLGVEEVVAENTSVSVSYARLPGYGPYGVERAQIPVPVQESKGSDNCNDQTTVVLNIEMHCQCCCAAHITQCAKKFQGVETADVEFNKKRLTVNGRMDPSQLIHFLRKETNKKIELVSPQPTHYNNNKINNKDDKSKELGKTHPQKTTAIIKPGCFCDGCIQKIKEVVSKIEGFKEVKKLDKTKETITVIGTMDIATLKRAVGDKLKKDVEVVVSN